MKSLFRNDLPWYKGNLHMHTTLSDGELTPEDAIDCYEQAGYDFIAVTDHRRPAKGGQYKNMLILPGVEWDCGSSKNPPVYHIVSIGGDYDGCELPNREMDQPQAIIDKVNKAGAIPILAHPTWSLMNPDELYDLTGVTIAEIFNSASDVPMNAARADASHYFDLWSMRGRFMAAAGVDDSHRYRGEECRTYTMVQAAELSEEAILNSLRQGNFYASQGPRFYEVRYDRDQVVIRFSEDVKTVLVYSNTVWVDERVFLDSQGQVTYQIMPTDRYLRIELIDGEGRRAWCSPFAVNQE